MKKLITGLALLAAAAAAAPAAQAAQAIFIGRIIVTGASGTCPNDPTGQRLTAMWMPANIGDNPPDSTLTIDMGVGSINYFLQGASFDSTLRLVKATQMFEQVGPVGYPVKVSFNTITPATITDITRFVNVVGKIRGFNFTNGCVANFRFAAVNRVD